MTLYAVQYLESMPPEATPGSVRQRLREACLRLPISHVLLGWELPEVIEQAVANEAARLNLHLFRWQPWLTGDAHTDLPGEWSVRGLDGSYVPGHNNQPEFTFVCPNRSGVADFLAERMETIAARGLYQGIFLDRIRFPSPAPDPAAHLGCFCSSCTRLAADAGVDLHRIRSQLQNMLSTANGALLLACGLINRREPETEELQEFLDFRERSITHMLEAASQQASQLSLSLILDCFSPSLARMVGQDLPSLNALCAWVKLMIYPRVWGPAGLSFELLQLVEWLVKRYNLNESAVFNTIHQVTGFELPSNQADFRKNGLPSASISLEIQRGRIQGVTSLLAGVALVDLPGIHESTHQQIQTDLLACQSADGLVLSWDLWHIPLSVLETIQK